MEYALIVTASEKSAAVFSELLHAAAIHQITAVPTCGEARRMFVERDFDLVIINAPLSDESGEALARYIAGTGITQVLLVVPAEHFEAISAICERDGVLTIGKPLNRSVLWSALKMAVAMQGRLQRFQSENSRLRQKIADIRVVDRAKGLLMSYLSMSEQEAHRYIERQAMDSRITKRAVAEGILKTYES